MPVHLNDIRRYHGHIKIGRVVTQSAAIRERVPIVFLSHSHKDKEAVESLQAWLEEEFNLRVYVDWQDHSLPKTPNRETAERIQDKIRDCNLFFFLATANSTASRWCPWEIGFADEVKGKDKIMIITTTDNYRNYGNEYLQLYKEISGGMLIDHITQERVPLTKLASPPYYYRYG